MSARWGSEVGHNLGVASEPGTRINCRSKPWTQQTPKVNIFRVSENLKSSWETHREASPQPSSAAYEEPGPSSAQSAGERLHLFSVTKERLHSAGDWRCSINWLQLCCVSLNWSVYQQKLSSRFHVGWVAEVQKEKTLVKHFATFDSLPQLQNFRNLWQKQPSHQQRPDRSLFTTLLQQGATLQSKSQQTE